VLNRIEAKKKKKKKKTMLEIVEKFMRERGIKGTVLTARYTGSIAYNLRNPSTSDVDIVAVYAAKARSLLGTKRCRERAAPLTAAEDNYGINYVHKLECENACASSSQLESQTDSSQLDSIQSEVRQVDIRLWEAAKFVSLIRQQNPFAIELLFDRQHERCNDSTMNCYASGEWVALFARRMEFVRSRELARAVRMYCQTQDRQRQRVWVGKRMYHVPRIVYLLCLPLVRGDEPTIAVGADHELRAALVDMRRPDGDEQRGAQLVDRAIADIAKASGEQDVDGGERDVESDELERWLLALRYKELR
jgi:hypothetical protein